MSATVTLIKLVVLNEKGNNARVGGDQINAGSPKEGRFCKTKRLVVVDCGGSQRTTQFESSDNFQVDS